MSTPFLRYEHYPHGYAGLCEPDGTRDGVSSVVFQIRVHREPVCPVVPTNPRAPGSYTQPMHYGLLRTRYGACNVFNYLHVRSTHLVEHTVQHRVPGRRPSIRSRLNRRHVPPPSTRCPDQPHESRPADRDTCCSTLSGSMRPEHYRRSDARSRRSDQ